MTGNESFQVVQATENASSTANSNANINTTVSSDGCTWTEVSPGVEKGTMPDGTEVGYNIDMNLALTPEDKQLVGWPCDDDSEMSTVACMIAGDRACGDLTGPVTIDYIMGNEDKHISGIVSRFQVSEDTVSAIMDNYIEMNE